MANRDQRTGEELYAFANGLMPGLDRHIAGEVHAVVEIRTYPAFFMSPPPGDNLVARTVVRTIVHHGDTVGAVKTQLPSKIENKTDLFMPATYRGTLRAIFMCAERMPSLMRKYCLVQVLVLTPEEMRPELLAAIRAQGPEFVHLLREECPMSAFMPHLEGIRGVCDLISNYVDRWRTEDETFALLHAECRALSPVYGSILAT